MGAGGEDSRNRLTIRPLGARERGRSEVVDPQTAMQALRNFFTRRREIGGENPSLDEVFSLIDLAQVQLFLDGKDRRLTALQLKGKSPETTAAEYRARAASQIHLLVTSGLLTEVGHDIYQLTPDGTEIFSRKH